MYIAVDFDGTVVDHDYPKIGKPVPNAIKHLIAWQAQGAQIILNTMRSGDELQEAVNYLNRAGVYLYSVNTNPAQRTWTNSPKVYAHIYIDDASAGVPLLHLKGFKRACVDWDSIATEVETKLNNYNTL